MKNKTEKGKQGSIARFCSAHEKRAKASLIICAAVVIATIGSVCGVAILSNSETPAPSENIELNAAEQYLSKASIESSETTPTENSTAVEESEKKPAVKSLQKKRGNLTGSHVVKIGDLKSLSDEDLVDAIISGSAGVIEISQIETDQSQNQDVVHTGSEATPPPPETSEPASLIDFELGIDISEFNGTIDWNAVKADGITFAFIRCGGRGWGSEGKIYKDNKLVTNVNNARAAGLKVGVYFFSQAITPYEALEEASFTLDLIKGLDINLPVVLDWETGTGYRTWDLYGQDYVNVLTAFCSTIAQNGYTPCVYTNTSDINNRLGSYSGEIFSKYKLWYAYPYSVYDPGSSSYIHNYYEAGDTIPPRSYFFEYWQYSWHGKVAGISTDVDLNLRILGSTSLSEPKINVANTSISSAVGQQIDPMDGVSAISSQDQDKTGDITYEIKDSSGNTVSLEKAQQKIGKYTITYTYKDSFKGTITATVTWEVTESGTPSPSSPESTTTSESTTSSETTATSASESTTATEPSGTSESTTGTSESTTGTSESTTGTSESATEQSVETTENSGETTAPETSGEPAGSSEPTDAANT